MFLLSIFVPLLAAKASSQPMTDARRPNINLRRAVRTYCVHEYISSLHVCLENARADIRTVMVRAVICFSWPLSVFPGLFDVHLVMGCHVRPVTVRLAYYEYL